MFWKKEGNEQIRAMIHKQESRERKRSMYREQPISCCVAIVIVHLFDSFFFMWETENDKPK